MKIIKTITVFILAVFLVIAISCDDPIDDDGARKLFTIAGEDVSIFGPSPSPDGKYLAFCYHIGNGSDSARLAIYNLQTGEITDLVTGDKKLLDYRSPVFSPDSRYIMYCSVYVVYIYSLDDDSIRQISPGNSWFEPVDWGRNGETVVVKDTNPIDEYGLYEVDLETLEMTYLAYFFGESYGRFSPDYNSLLISLSLEDDFSNYLYQVRLYDTTTWEYELLFECVNYGYVGSGGWSRNGEEVLLVQKVEDDEEFIRVYNLSTGVFKTATWTPRGSAEEGYATSRIGSVSFSTSEDKIYYHTGIPPGIYVVDTP
ncbi:MAG: hypothetical protein GY771_01095 [bacterium]|nr:hypothetical protein [bacterium]